MQIKKVPPYCGGAFLQVPGIAYYVTDVLSVPAQAILSKLTQASCPLFIHWMRSPRFDSRLCTKGGLSNSASSLQ